MLRPNDHRFVYLVPLTAAVVGAGYCVAPLLGVAEPLAMTLALVSVLGAAGLLEARHLARGQTDHQIDVPLFGQKPDWMGHVEKKRGTLSMAAEVADEGALSEAAESGGLSPSEDADAAEDPTVLDI